MASKIVPKEEPSTEPVIAAPAETPATEEPVAAPESVVEEPASESGAQQWQCQKDGTVFRSDDHLAGKLVRCPKCNGIQAARI